jgi:probable HAF family extracellular repeat protein
MSIAFACSWDGKIVVGGSSWNPPESAMVTEAFRWEDGEMVGLGFLQDGYSSHAYDISGDGTIIVGTCAVPILTTRAVRWVNGIIEDLGVPVGVSPRDINANAISPDGTVIVGHYYVLFSNNPVRWVNGDLIPLEKPEGYDYCRAWDVSNGGEVIIGDASSPGLDTQVVLWRRSKDYTVEFLKDILEDHGIDLEGFQLTWASAISADGFTVVGIGNGPGVNQEGWVVRFPEYAGYPVDVYGNIDTGPRLGKINVIHGPHVYIHKLDGWAYSSEEFISDDGMWLFNYEAQREN